MNVNRCETCKWCVKAFENDKIGKCYRFPPVAVTAYLENVSRSFRSQVDWKHPRVDCEYGFCGEWMAR